MASKNFSVSGARNVIRTLSNEFIGPTGADILKQAASFGKNQKACVVIVNDQKFNTSSYGYEGRVVLINTATIIVPPEAIMVGTELGRITTAYALLKPKYAQLFLKVSA